MALLHVHAQVRWAGGQPDQIIAGTPTFQLFPMTLSFSVTDADGVPLDQIDPTWLHVGYQWSPDAQEDSIAVLSALTRHGPTIPPGRHWFSCVVSHQPDDVWAQDEIFIAVMISRPSPSGTGHDSGRTHLLARYHQFA
jgi:hypothetical protein